MTWLGGRIPWRGGVRRFWQVLAPSSFRPTEFAVGHVGNWRCSPRGRRGFRHHAYAHRSRARIPPCFRPLRRIIRPRGRREGLVGPRGTRGIGSQGIDRRKSAWDRIIDRPGGLPILVRRCRLRPRGWPRTGSRPSRPASRRRRRGRPHPTRRIGIGPRRVIPLGCQGQEGPQAARPQQDHCRQSERGHPKQRIQLPHAKPLSRRTATERSERISPPVLYWQPSWVADYSGPSCASARSVCPSKVFCFGTQLFMRKQHPTFNTPDAKACFVKRCTDLGPDREVPHADRPRDGKG